MKLLKELNLDDNTVVFFTSDNGTTYLKEQVDYEFFESVGELRGLKGSLYEGGIRVPMIARWPGKIKPNTVTNHIAANYDILETLAEVTGGTPDIKTDGISFLPILISKPDKQKKAQYLFWDFAGYGGQLAVRMGDWKAIKGNLKKNPEAKLEIYHLKNDPSEKNNVVDQYPKLAAKFETIMLEARVEPDVKRFRFGKYPPKK